MTDRFDLTQPELLTISADKILSPSQLKKNSFWGIARCINAILLFALSYPIYLRFLGLEIYGIWVMLIAVVTCLQYSSLNLPQAAAKFISESLVRKDAATLYQDIATLIAAVLAIGLSIIFFAFLAKALLAGFLKSSGTVRPQLPFLIMLTGLLSFQVLATETLGGIVSGAGRMDRVFQADMLCRVLGFLLSLGLLYHQYELLALFYGNMAGYLVYGILILVLIKRNLGAVPLRWHYLSWQRLRRMVRFTGPLFGGSLLTGLLQPFNRLLLGTVISPAAASIFDIADKGAQVIRSTAETGIRPLMVQISGLDSLRDDGRIRSLSLKCEGTILLWITPLVIIAYLISGHLIPLWLKLKETGQIDLNFHILIVGYFANLIGVPIFYGFMGAGQVNNCFRANLIQTIVNVVIAIIAMLVAPQIWVISFAFSAGMIVACLDLIIRFSKDRLDFIRLMIKGIKKLCIPCISFIPLLFFKQHLYGLVIAATVICLLYTLMLKRLITENVPKSI